MFQRVMALMIALALMPQAHGSVAKDSKNPPRISDKLLILPSGWASMIPPHGAVNAPHRVQALAPGQNFEVALLSFGDKPEQLFHDPVVSIRISTASGVVEQRKVKAIVIRKVKAIGGDMILQALKSGGIKGTEIDKVKKNMEMQAVAVFDTSWKAPTPKDVEKITVKVSIVSGVISTPNIKRAHLQVRPWSDWRKSKKWDRAAMSQFVYGFHADPKPGLLLPLLTAAAKAKVIKEPPVYSFFVAAFRKYPLAKRNALTSLSSLDPSSKRALLTILRLGGDDISGLMKSLPAGTRSWLKKVQPMKDPRKFARFSDPVDPQAVSRVGSQMDECWGEWMATGDHSYLFALVGLLKNAPDFPALKKWQQEKGGVKGLNAHVANGLSYEIAGWSLLSFQHTDPLVADWLSFWQHDPKIPKDIREQIKELPFNPDFQRHTE